MRAKRARLRQQQPLQPLASEPVSEAGSYLRLIDSCITQLKAQGPSGTCNESKEEGEEETVSGFGSRGKGCWRASACSSPSSLSLPNLLQGLKLFQGPASRFRNFFRVHSSFPKARVLHRAAGLGSITSQESRFRNCFRVRKTREPPPAAPQTSTINREPHTP